MNALTSARKPKLGFLTMIFCFLLTLTSCVDSEDGTNLEIPGVDGPHVTLSEDNLLISMIFENMHLEGGLRYNIPKYPTSYLEITPALQSDGTLLAMNVALDDIFNMDYDELDPQKLPGGRNLPGVAKGTLPAVAFSIEKFPGMVFYVGPEVFGIFTPASINAQGAMLTSRYYVDNVGAGTLTLVGEDENEENSGILLLLDMKGKMGKFLKKRAEKY